MIARWKIVVLIKKCFVRCLSACSIVPLAWWFRLVIHLKDIFGSLRNAFCEIFLNEWRRASSVLLALMIVFFACWLRTTPYTIHLPSQRKAKLFFTFTLFYVIFFFWISKRNFLCFFIHCSAIEKLENEYEFSSSDFSILNFCFSRELPKKVLLDSEKRSVWRVQ